jgi:hypothetical protein
MTSSARFALYFTPQPGSALDRFGAGVLGYDPTTGADVRLTSLRGIHDTDRVALTEEPRRYGFHATLKAPFRLKGESEDLLAAVRAFAASRPPLQAVRLGLEPVGRFLALVSDDDTRLLDLFAAEIVALFDKFRAPLSDGERARRLSAPLSARHRALLETWGYPFVFEAFRFHMTLAGPLPEPQRSHWCESLREHLPDLASVSIDALTLLRQDNPESRFRIVERVTLGGDL